MAKWIATITNAGTALLNSQVSGADLVIVGAVSSSTETAADELAKLTEMTNIKQELTLGSASVDNTNSTFSIPVTLLNDDLEVSYALKQIGIYAQDPTDTENKILFAVAQIDVARVINLPADAPGYKLEIDLNFQNTTNSNVIVKINTTDISTHMKNNNIHVSEEEKTTWNNYPETIKAPIEHSIKKAFNTSYLRTENFLLDKINVSSNTRMEIGTSTVAAPNTTYKYVQLVYKDMGKNALRKLCSTGSNSYAIYNLSNGQIKTFAANIGTIIILDGTPYFTYKTTTEEYSQYRICKLYNDEIVEVSDYLTQTGQIFLHNDKICYYFKSSDTLNFYEVNNEGADRLFSTLTIGDLEIIGHVDSLDGVIHLMGITTYWASRSYTNWHYVLEDGVWIKYTLPYQYYPTTKNTLIYNNELYLFGSNHPEQSGSNYSTFYKWDKTTKTWGSIGQISKYPVVGYPFIYDGNMYYLCRLNSTKNVITGLYKYNGGTSWSEVSCLLPETAAFDYYYVGVAPYTVIDEDIYIQSGRTAFKVLLTKTSKNISNISVQTESGNETVYLRDLGTDNYVQANQVIAGHYNNYNNSTAGASSGTSGQAFCIGNGTSSSRANALRVSYGGNIYAQSSTVGTGADYSEYFEWLDGNEDNEDRVGYFVTFDDKQKIRKANATDDYILGIVSGLPCIIGNGDEDWRGRYILDEFGRFIEETFEYEETVINSETGEEETVVRTGTKYKENPEYDASQQYIERAKRKEWSAIGMIGVLSVYDDGTCQENGYCTVSDGGIATACESGSINTYRVLERVTENIVKVLFR